MSVKERVGYDRPNPLSLKWTGDGYIAEGMPVDWVITTAYGVKSQLIAQLPDWISTKRFDILLKVSPDDAERFGRLPIKEKAPMLRQVLEERFRMKAHFEPRMMPVYELVKRKDSSLATMCSTEPAELQKKRFMVGGDFLKGEHAGMNDFANALWNIAGRKVIDKTGITGTCDFTLRWSGGEGLTGAPSAPSEYPSIFEALKEQLGLELRSSNAPVDFLMIDHIEMPSSN